MVVYGLCRIVMTYPTLVHAVMSLLIRGCVQGSFPGI